MSYTALRLDDVEGVPWPGGITWHPLRMDLGLRAFGAAAYSGGPGDIVVEPHVEATDGRGHEEVYVVLRGAATFTLGDDTIDAPPGMIVRVDADTFRTAKATQPDTLVLAFGGPPTFELSGSEWLMRAKPLMRDDPERARALLEEGLREVPHSAAIPFGLALLAATHGDDEEARRQLNTALTREPRLEAEVASEPLLRDLKGPGPFIS